MEAVKILTLGRTLGFICRCLHIGASNRGLLHRQWFGTPLRPSLGATTSRLLGGGYTQTKVPMLHDRLQESTRSVLMLRTSLTKKKMLQQSQNIFEEGERSGRLLAWLVCEQSPSTSVLSVVDKAGIRQTASRAITDCFAFYYTEPYSSWVDYSMEDLHIHLSDVDFCPDFEL